MVTTTAKTIDDMQTEVRLILNDNETPYRYPVATIVQVFNTALREVYRLRPDAYIGNFTSGQLSSNPANTYSVADFGLTPGTPFPLDDRLFFGPIVFYVAGRLEIEDDEFADDKRAALLMTAFKEQLTGVGGG
jgi:hypothetical protein